MLSSDGTPWRYSALILTLVVALLVRPTTAGTEAPELYTTFSQSIMSTRIDVMVPAGADAPDHAEAVFEIFRRIEAEANEWREHSALAEVNRASGGEAVAVSKELWELVRRGRELGKLTEGAFDITWAALWGLWDFNAAEPRVPEQIEVSRRIELVDYRKVELMPASRSIRLPRAGMKIGLGGIAKGFALDRAATVLRERGVSNFSLSAGGQVYVGGRRGAQRPWRVGVRDPRGSADDDFVLLQVEDVSISTSGDYERFFLHQGVRYHHILDPRTGFPARGLRSATVVAADATLADALSTAFMVLGRDRALQIANSTPGIEALLVDESARVYVTVGLAGRLIRRHPPLP